MAAVDDMMNCPVCFEVFGEEGDHVPRMLQCFHTQCEKCIGHLLQNDSIECPECRTRHSLPANADVKSFPQNKYVIAYIRKNAENEMEEKCEEHKRGMSLFCNETKCQVPVCSLCVVRNHKGHDFQDFHEIKKETNKTVVKNLQTAKEGLRSKKENLLATKELLDKKTLACVGKIEEKKEEQMKMFNDLIKDATKRMKEMKVKIDENLAIIDADMWKLRIVEDDAVATEYETMVENLATIEEITDNMTTEKQVYRYPQYTESSSPNISRKLSMKQVDVSGLGSRGKYAVTDLKFSFPRKRGCANLSFGEMFAENCMKMKEIGPRGASTHHLAKVLLKTE